MRASEGGAKAASWRDLPVEKRIAHALVKGIDEFAVVVRHFSLTPAWVSSSPSPSWTTCSVDRLSDDGCCSYAKPDPALQRVFSPVGLAWGLHLVPILRPRSTSFEFCLC